MIAPSTSARLTWHDAFVDKETKAHRDHADGVLVHQVEAVHSGAKWHWFQHVRD
jgi:hypothetical protein